MKPIQPIATLNQNAIENIKILHAGLRFLWSIANPPITAPIGNELNDFQQEEQSQDAAAMYGLITKKLVTEFRKSQNLGGQDLTNTDESTARAMNVMLLGARQIRGILGTVSIDAEGKQGVPGAQVRAYNFQGSAESELGTASFTDAVGQYAIFLEKKEGDSKVNVFSKAFGLDYESGAEQTIGRTDTEWNVLGGEAVRVDLKVLQVKAGAAGPIEFTQLKQKVSEKLETLGLPKTIEEIKAEQIETILLRHPDFIRVPRIALEYLVLAHLFSSDIGKRLDAGFFYAFLRTDALLYTVWSINQNGVDAQTSINLAKLEGTDKAAKTSRRKYLGEIAFYSTLTDTDPKGDPIKEVAVKDVCKSAVFARFVEYDYFEQAQKEKFSPVLKELRKELVKEQPEGLTVGFFERATGEFMLCKNGGALDGKDPTLKALADSKKLSEPADVWKDRAPYARVIALILDGQEKKESPFAGFRILTGNAYIVAVGPQNAKWNEPLPSALLGLQRVVKLTVDPGEVAFLLKLGWDSAWKIRMSSHEGFVGSYVAEFQGGSADDAELTSRAELLYSKAAAAADGTAHALAEARSLATAQDVDALCKKSDRKVLNQRIVPNSQGAAPAILPSWERLFGSLDACACGQCQSIHGPGSYLVDVLQYFKRLETGHPKACAETVAEEDRPCLCGAKGKKFGTVFDVLMNRRPDLGHLDLNCANAMTPVPYIDLVCEILEDCVCQTANKRFLNLEPGKKFPGNLLNEYQSLFPELTSAAMVTADSLDNRLVRDKGVLVLFERQYGNDGKPSTGAGGCPEWHVRQLRQTYGTEAEIGAAPEYVNQAAYNALAGPPSCLALPFDLDRNEAASYLSKMDTDRATVIQQVSKWPAISAEPPANALIIAAEVLGLTITERELITQPKIAEQHEYWAENSDTLVKNVSQLRIFLDKTELKTEPVDSSELEELLAGKFINPCTRTIKDVSDDPSNPVTECDATHRFLKRVNEATGEYTEPLQKEDFDRIHRFLRLWRKLGWPINLLDRLIMSPAVGKGNLDEDCLIALAEIVRLAKEWELEPIQAAAWFADLSTFGEKSDYRRIFLQKLDGGHAYPSFLLEKLCPPDDCKTGAGVVAKNSKCEPITKHAEFVARAVGISKDDLQVLLGYGAEGGKPPEDLSLRDLSRTWAWYRFARKLGLKISEFVQVLKLRGIADPLSSQRDARKVWETLTLMKSSGFKIADARFWLLDRTQNEDERKKRIIPDLAIGAALNEIRKAFATISATRTAREIKLDEQGTAGDNQATCLEKLGSSLATVEGFKAEDALKLTNLLLARPTADDVSALNALLTSSVLKDISGVAAHATEAPINAAGAWDESDAASHAAYQKWTADFLKDLLKFLDDRARENAIINGVARQTKAPAEVVETILRFSRMPTDAGPAKGSFLLKVLMEEGWTEAPIPGGLPVDEAKLRRALWDAAFCPTQAEVDALQDNPSRFRKAVLADEEIAAVISREKKGWAKPPELAVAELWRKELSQRFVAIRLTHKIAGLATALKMKTDEHLAWGLAKGQADKNRFQELGWYSPDEMPLKPTSETATAYEQWKELLEGLALLTAYPLVEAGNDPNTKMGAATALELALKPGPPPDRKKPYDVDTVSDILSVCYDLFGSPDQEMKDLAEWLEIPRDAFRRAKSYRYLEQAGKMIAKLGISLSLLPALTEDTVRRPLVLALRQALKQQSDADTWLETLKEIQDPLREQKRDALVAYLIADREHRCFKDVDDLYDHLLIDTQMCACMPTSRVVQAHAVVQLFAQRCQMGQEPAVDPRADRGDRGTGNDWREWTWMRNFRVWEANRKVFLYPENWIEPDLRDDKSQFFKEFEQTLLQSEVNDVNVETAARAFLDKLDDAAFLEVMAVHYQDVEYSENGKPEGRALHVIGRSKGGDPPTYYYRRFVSETRWTPWEMIDLDIVTDHVLLFIRNSRLNIAWPVFTDVVNEEAVLHVPTQNTNAPIPKFPRGWTIQLAMSERSNGRWQPKRTSKEQIETPLVTAAADRMENEKKRCRFFVLDKEPREYFLTTEDEFRTGFFITIYGFLEDDKKEEKNILAPGVQKEPKMLGAFNLAGCKGTPEVVTKQVQKDYLAISGGSTTTPRIRDAELESQRWVERAGDADNDLVIEGLMANNLAPTRVFDSTPGTFKVTIAQQNTLLDRAILDALKLMGQEPERWRPGGVLTPFFYEDGRRGYVAVPTIRAGDLGEITIDDILANVALLYPDLSNAANPKPNQAAQGAQGGVAAPQKQLPKSWPELIQYWDGLKEGDPVKAAYVELKRQLSGCFGLKFGAFYHPFVCLMKRVLAQDSFEGLMKLSPLNPRPPAAQDNDEFKALFAVAGEELPPVVLRPTPQETAGFAFEQSDSYSSYNWEIFYHLPTLVSQKMTAGQQYENALRWFHFVFNPTGAADNVPAPGRYWVTKPFQQRSAANNQFDTETYVGQRIESILRLLNDPSNTSVGDHWAEEVAEWRKNPFVPHQVARGRTVAFQKATVMRYLDALIQWGDYLFRQDTREAVNEALQLYITAERLLGPRPRLLKPATPAPTRTYRELELIMCGERSGVDSFGNSLVELENLLPPASKVAVRTRPCMPALPAGCLVSKPYFCIPRNEKLLGYWDTVADRLYKIRHCQNIEGVERQLALFAPPIDPGLLVRAVAGGLSIGSILAQGAGELPQYRFQILAQKATELVQMVISLGNSLVQAIEKKDAEALAQLRSNQELSLLKLVKEIKIKQIQEALQNLAGLQRTKVTTETRRNYYRDIKYTNKLEEKSLDLNEEGTGFESASLTSNTAANVFHLLPDIDIGGSGFGGSPVAKVRWGGQNLGQAASAMGQFLGGKGSLKRAAAGAVGTRAGYERRWDDWKLQERLAERELKQIECQIRAAEIRIEITKGELTNHEKQMEHAQEILAYLKDRKFSNQDLYDWMIGQISANYFQAWQLAHRFALRAERAFHFELGPRNERGEFDSYVRYTAWDSLKKGLLAGDSLLFDIKRMETDFLERNRRDFEITKHISLVRLSPMEFIKLKKTGKCQIDLKEWLFDMDYPGHYFRRIKSVSLSIPCVAGPYAGVNCTLTLTKSAIRKTNQTQDDPEDDEANLLRNFSRIQSIATSSAQNDSGMFEVNFRDERYLPFEGAGAVSTWTLQLHPQDNRQLDYDSITDVTLHVKYTSRFGGTALQNKQRKTVDGYFTNGEQGTEKPIVQRLLFLKDEFPSEWRRFTADEKTNKDRLLTIAKIRDRMPYFWPDFKDSAVKVKVLTLRDGDNLPNSLTLRVKENAPVADGAGAWKDVPWDGNPDWSFSCKTDRVPELALLVEATLQPSKI